MRIQVPFVYDAVLYEPAAREPRHGYTPEDEDEDEEAAEEAQAFY